MKKKSLIWATLALLIGSTACETISSETELEKKPVRLQLSLSSNATKVTGETTQAEDNTITTVDVFVFENPEENVGEKHLLDAYKRFTGSDLSDISLDCSTGDKLVCVIANSPYDNYANLVKLSEFRILYAQLNHERQKCLSMYGETTATLDQSSQSLQIPVTRFASKVSLTSIKTNFAGTTLEGKEISNVKIYLINAYAGKFFRTNTDMDPAMIFNKGMLMKSDINYLDDSSILVENITTNLTDAGLSETYTFYCYENITNNIPNCTMLVIQGDINGSTYYYPVPINQEQFGYQASNKHYGIRRNTCYSVGVTITGLGSDNPTTPIYTGAIDVTIEPEDWTSVPHFDKVF
jgi:hypothetical protein